MPGKKRETIANMLPFAVRVVDRNGKLIHEFPTLGIQTTIKTWSVLDRIFCDVPIIKSIDSKPYNMPPVQSKLIYIVPERVCRVHPRHDLVYPDPESSVYDQETNTLTCLYLRKN